MTVPEIPSLTRSEGVVLGLIARYGPMSPYELKGRAAEAIGTIWPIPHAQLYRDPARLAELGLLDEEVEAGGRRRRVFSITKQGRAALRAWLTDELATETQIRDPALLKLTFADLAPAGTLAALATAQAELHRGWLAEYEHRAGELDDADPATPMRRHLLDAGRAIEAAYAEFWERLPTS